MSGRRPRLLLAIAGLPAGGAERQMSLLAQGLDRDRFEVGLLIFGRAERIHYPEIFDRPLWFRALAIPGHRPRPVIFAALFAGIRRAVAEFAPSLIHTSLNVANHAVRATALLSGWRLPIVTSVRNDFRRAHGAAERRAERLLSRRSCRIVTNSEAIRQQLLADLALKPERVVTIPNGLDPRFAPGPVAAPPAGWPPHWPAGAPVGLSIGRFVPTKNQLGLIRALGALDGMDALGEWRFLFVGEGPLEAELRAAAAPLGERIAFLPPRPDPVPLYRSAALLIVPSLAEGLPNVVIEAQACGCPVAASPAARAAGAVSEGNGWELDAEAGRLAESLRAALAALAAERRRRGAAAALDIAARFSMERMVASHERVFEACLAKASP